MIDSATMAKVSKIHQSKQPVRRHYLAEWLEARSLKPMDLVELLNDPERSSEFTEIDKTQVYRWLRGQLPHPGTQLRIASVLGFEGEPEKLMQHPSIDWLSPSSSQQPKASNEPTHSGLGAYEAMEG